MVTDEGDLVVPDARRRRIEGGGRCECVGTGVADGGEDERCATRCGCQLDDVRTASNQLDEVHVVVAEATECRASDSPVVDHGLSLDEAGVLGEDDPVARDLVLGERALGGEHISGDRE